MNSVRFRLTAAACLVLLLVTGSWAQGVEEPLQQGGDGTTLRMAPDLSVFSVMKFAGALKGSFGEPRTGAVGVTFAFYSEQTGGAPLWLETQNVQLDSQGSYSVLLGITKTEGLPQNFFSSGEARWLGIQVGTEAEQQRILLVSVPYALKAAEAETLGGFTAGEFVRNDELETQIQKQLEEQAAETIISVGDAAAKEIAESGVRSTFTDNNATDVVFVDQTGTGFAVRGRSTTGAAVAGVSTSTTGASPGVQGSSRSDTGKGIVGLATHATGLTMGIRGEALSTAGRGIVGIASASSGPTVGVQAVTFSPDGIGMELITKTVGGQLFRGLSGQPAVEVFSVSGTGTVTAAAFAGDGQLLTNLPVVGTNGGTVTDITAGAGLVATATNPITVTGALAIDPAVVPQLGSTNNFTANQNVTGTVTATSFVGNGSGLTGVSAQPELHIRGINYLAGCDTCDVLTDADDQPTFFINVVGAMTVNSVTCFSDAGTPTINIQRDDGTPANLLSANLACSTSGVTTTTFTGGEDALGVNDKLDFVLVTAGGVAKRVLVAIKATVN
jgi:hypothetical protein